MRKLLVTLCLLVLVSGIGLAAHVDQAITEHVKNAKADALIPVIVQLNPGYQAHDAVALGGKSGHVYTIINGYSAHLPAAAIERLSRDAGVFSISYDKEVKAQLNVASATLNSNFLWLEGYTGEGVTIAIVDTGIYPHPDFQSRIIGFKDYINSRTTTYDDNGHGTHGAGCAAGNGVVYDGPARDAKLVGVKVLNSSGSGSTSVIISGINWVVSNRATYGIKVMSLALGGTVTQSSNTDPLCAAVRNAWNSGIVVVTTAGSSGPGASTIGCPGNEPLSITVGSSDDKSTVYVTDDTIASFTSRGPTAIDGWIKPDVVAPGVNITAAYGSSSYTTWSGSSAPTAIVAGVCAQYLEAYPTAVPETVKSNIKGSARPLQGYDVNAQGAGLVDAYYAVH